ncbi:MAG: tail fiber protein [Acidobacteriota bacterium]|nr:tail fiber protein [Acidobacteriota bacterium]
MSDQFVAEIRMFPLTFAPSGWADANGQLLPISQNTSLFALLGTTYGGDGKSTFALPDLQGSVPLQPGWGPGLTERFLGEQSGVEAVTLLQSEIPAHTHSLGAANSFANNTDPTGRLLSRIFGGGNLFKANTAPTDAMDLNSIAPAGGGVPHNNMMPYLTVRFCIALQGVFPQRP